MAIEYNDKKVNAVKCKGKTPYLVEYNGEAYEGYPIALYEICVDSLFQYLVDKPYLSYSIKPTYLHPHLNYRKTNSGNYLQTGVANKYPLGTTVYMDDILTLPAIYKGQRGWVYSRMNTHVAQNPNAVGIYLGIDHYDPGTSSGEPLQAKIKPTITPTEGSSEEFVSFSNISSNPIIFGLDNDTTPGIIENWSLDEVVNTSNTSTREFKFTFFVNSEGPNGEAYTYGIDYICELLKKTGVIYVGLNYSVNIDDWQAVKIYSITNDGKKLTFYAQPNQTINSFDIVALFAEKNTLSPIPITSKFSTNFKIKSLIEIERVNLNSSSSSDGGGYDLFNDYLEFKIINKTPFKVVLYDVEFGVELDGFTTYIKTPISEINLDPYGSYVSNDFGPNDFGSDLADPNVVKNFRGYYRLWVSNLTIYNNRSWEIENEYISGEYGEISYLPLRKEF